MVLIRMEETIGDEVVGAGDRSVDDMLPCSLMVSDWHAMIVSCLRHCFQLGKYCDLVIQFSDGASIKVHRVVLESCCSLAHVGKTCEEDPGLVVAHAYVTADVLCPLIRFLYTGVITLTASQLRLARVIQLTLLLDCVRKLGLTDATSYEPDYEDRQNEETSQLSLPVLSAHPADGGTLGSDGVVAVQSENVFHSSNSSIRRDHPNDIFSAHQASNSVCSPNALSSKLLVNFHPEMRDCDLRTSVNADNLTEANASNRNQKKVNDGTDLSTDFTTPSDIRAFVSPMTYTECKNGLSNGLKEPEKLHFHDNSYDTPAIPTDDQLSKAVDSISSEISFNSSQLTESACNSKISAPRLSESQFENGLEGKHPSFNDHSFGLSDKFDQKISTSSSSPITLRSLLTSESFCTPTDVFTHASSEHTSSSAITESSWASASSANNGSVQASCDSAFDALLLGEPEKRPSSDTPSPFVASSTAGNNSSVEGSLTNILLLPTNSQMLEKANAAARRRRRSETRDVPRPTRFLLDDSEKVSGAGQHYFGAAFREDGALHLSDSPAQNSGLFNSSLKISRLTNSRLGALANDLGKLDSSITNIPNNNSCHTFNSKTDNSHDRSLIAYSYPGTPEMSEESEVNFSGPLIPQCKSSSVDDRKVVSALSSSAERIPGSKIPSTNLNVPNKKAKLESAKQNSITTATVKDVAEGNDNPSSSRTILKETRELLTPSTSPGDSMQSLFESGKIPGVGFQFSRSTTKNSLNCYEIKSRDDSSFEVVPSSVALKGKSNAPIQNHVNESELNSHAKIITEVLKKFPNLIKDKKNVKLKIMKHVSDKNSSGNEIEAENTSSQSVVSNQSTESARNTTFRCSKCLQLFATHFSLKKHILNSHEEPTEVLRQSGSKLYACWRCSGRPQCFDTNVQLQRHVKEVHRTDLLQCGHCGYRSARSIDVAFHMFKEHGTAPPRNYYFPKCTACSFVGRSASDLERHRASRHSADSYACTSCDVNFRSLGALQGHVQAKVCQNKPGASFMCPHCSETFTKSYNLKAHLRSRHKNLKFRRVESTPSDRICENISSAHPSESQADTDKSEIMVVKHKQDSAVPNYLFSFDNKMAFDASDDFQVDNTCASSSFIVSNDALKSNETYSVVKSNSGFIEIVSSCTDGGAARTPRPLTQSTILGALPAVSCGDVHPCPKSADAAWMCLSSNAVAAQVTCHASVPSSVTKNPFSV